MSQKKKSRTARHWSPVHPSAAAIDIGATMHVAAVGPDRDKEPARTFRTFTGDLERLADWFARCGVKTIAMESTGGLLDPGLRDPGTARLRGEGGQRPGREACAGAQDRCQRCAMAPTTSRIRLTARQFPAPGRDRGAACLSAAAGTTVGLCSSAYPAHAEGADADEPVAASCPDRHYRRDGSVHHPRDRGGRARPKCAGFVP